MNKQNFIEAIQLNRKIFYEDDTTIRWKQIVTPEIAAAYLSEQAPNRKLSSATAYQYAEDIKRGNWVMTHENAIALDHNGNGIDLQHRMYGVVLAQISVEMEFYQYKNEKDVVAAQKAMGGGRFRTNSDKAQILYGMTNAMRKLSVLGLLKMMATNQSPANKKIGIERRMQMYDYFQDGADLLGSHSFAAYVSAPLVFIYRKDPDFVNDVVDRLHTGANLSAKTPVLTMRNFMHSAEGKGGGGTNNYRKALKVFNALKAEFQERELTKLYDSDNGMQFFFKRQPDDVQFLMDA